MTLYLIAGIIALCLILWLVVRFYRGRIDSMDSVISLKQKAIDTLTQEIDSQQEEIRKRDEMIQTLQEIEIDHLKKSKKLRTSDPDANVRNASDIMSELAGTGGSD